MVDGVAIVVAVDSVSVAVDCVAVDGVVFHVAVFVVVG